MRLVDADQVADLSAARQVVQDRAEVVFVEAAGRGGQTQRLVNLCRTEDGGELDRAGHLGPDPGGAGGGGLDQPLVRPVADGQEVGLGLGVRPGSGWAGMVAAGMVRVVLVEDARVSRGGQRVPGDLDGAGGAHRDDG